MMPRVVSVRAMRPLLVALLLLAPSVAWAAVCGKVGTTYTMGTGACAGETDPAVNGTNLQDTINAASMGDTLVLTPGGGIEYRGNFTLPDKGAWWLFFRRR